MNIKMALLVATSLFLAQNSQANNSHKYRLTIQTIYIDESIYPKINSLQNLVILSNTKEDFNKQLESLLNRCNYDHRIKSQITELINFPDSKIDHTITSYNNVTYKFVAKIVLAAITTFLIISVIENRQAIPYFNPN